MIFATTWLSAETGRPSLASSACCRPSEKRLPSSTRPEKESMMRMRPSDTMYSLSRAYSSLALMALMTKKAQESWRSKRFLPTICSASL